MWARTLLQLGLNFNWYWLHRLRIRQKLQQTVTQAAQHPLNFFGLVASLAPRLDTKLHPTSYEAFTA